ncbi:hypothetical protein [Pseudohaliea rubra]|uniref:Uncharacterized protein n=1 Tax=Pseudohaliea rubra DSM 19751 TaxID=1265313 RepID=A0A095VTZ9_9GAMM|nr:hypothetical protein [Pseudohaliea rubra]KGE04937.1 hypothetical protein HRUBRA_00410 [Pseudohaliea rubra DSM 19751]
MFGFGKKDEEGRQVRVEHRGKHTRLSRTGGAAVRAEARAGPLGATVNSSKGLRLSARLARGARFGLQNGRTQFIGRWRNGPFALNASKSGISASVKTGAGTLNLLKPRYSSFKVAGVQVRGQHAVVAQLAVMGMQVGFALVMTALRLVTWATWLLWLALRFLWDLLRGMVQGFGEIDT